MGSREIRVSGLAPGLFKRILRRVSVLEELMSLETVKRIRKTIHWLLALGLVVYIVTGFGITEWQTVEPLTLGLLGKAESQKIHNAIEIPFVALLLAHLYLSLIKRKHSNVS